MKYDFSVARECVEDQVYWIARCKEVNTIVGQGDTPEEAIKELESNETAWLEMAADLGMEIPEVYPTTRRQYSGKFMTRISPTAHATAAAFASADGISLNQYVSDAISYYNGHNERMSIGVNITGANAAPIGRKQM